MIVWPWLFFLILNGYLFLKLCDATWHLKPLIFAHCIFIVAICLIVGFGAIAGYRRRTSTLKVNMPLWEPGKISTALETPVWVCLLSGHMNFVSNKIWEVIVTCSCLVEIGTHCFHKFFLTCSVKHSPLRRSHRTRKDRSVLEHLAPPGINIMSIFIHAFNSSFHY